MKLLHINSYYSSSKFYKNLYDQQLKSSLDIDVFVPVSTSYKNNGFDFGDYTNISTNHSKYDRLFFHVKHKKILKDITVKYEINKISLVHAHSLFSNGYIAMKLKEEYGLPYIVAVRNTDVNLFFRKMIHLRKLGVKILENSNGIIFLSAPYRDIAISNYVPKEFRKTIYDKSSIIPNGIDDFWFDNLGSPKKLEKSSEIRLLQVGDVNNNKNIETTAKAVGLLSQEGFSIKLSVVGKIKDKRIFNRISKYNFVNYLGYKSKEELIHIYRDSDIFILPSKHETFGLVYAEAMSQGLPVIYTKGQGFDGQFKNEEVGFSVKYDKIDEVAKAVKKTIDNYENISSNCIENVDKFRWSNIEKSYQDAYEGIIE